MLDLFNPLSDQTEGQWLKNALGINHTGLVAILTSSYLVDRNEDAIFINEDASVFAFKISDEIDRDALMERIVAWIKEEEILEWAESIYEDDDIDLDIVYIDDFEAFDSNAGISLVKQHDTDSETIFEGVVDENALRDNIDHVLKYDLKIGVGGNDLRNQMALNF